MLATTQDTICLRNIKYKDNNNLDKRIKGHPVIIISVNETSFYYLTISSSSNENKKFYDKNYFKIKGNKINKLKSPVNYINLKNIYKMEEGIHVPIGFIEDRCFKNLIKRLIEFQEEIQEDLLYKEIKDELKQQIKDLQH